MSENSTGQELLVSKSIAHVHDEIESVSNLNACPKIEITFESDDAEPPLFDAFHTWSHAPMCFQDDDANKDAIATICGFEKTMLDHLADDLSQAMANSNDDVTDKSLLASLDLVQLFSCSFVMDDLPTCRQHKSKSAASDKTSDDVRTFRKGIHRDASAFPKLQKPKLWDAYHRELKSKAATQGLSHALDPTCHPGSTQDWINLFQEQQKFMCNVFMKTILTDKGESFV